MVFKSDSKGINRIEINELYCILTSLHGYLKYKQRVIILSDPAHHKVLLVICYPTSLFMAG